MLFSKKAQRFLPYEVNNLHNLFLNEKNKTETTKFQIPTEFNLIKHLPGKMQRSEEKSQNCLQGLKFDV